MEEFELFDEEQFQKNIQAYRDLVEQKKLEGEDVSKQLDKKLNDKMLKHMQSQDDFNVIYYKNKKGNK